jgi:ATP-dependent phosphoenolpyruvate carboxykinase
MLVDTRAKFSILYRKISISLINTGWRGREWGEGAMMSFSQHRLFLVHVTTPHEEANI